MSEKQTLSTWLRSKEVYQDAAAEDSETKSRAWRNALLSEFDSSTTIPLQKPRSKVDQSAPLEVHHLLLMMPVGLALFALGWLFGSHTISMEDIGRVSPWVWTGSSIVVSVGFLKWRGHDISWRR